jgi:LAO/AO transport system kinase
MHSTLKQQMEKGDRKALARCISLVENGSVGSDELLTSLNNDRHTPVIGFTGPPGAGKSSIINALISRLTSQNKQVAVIAVDPTSPFNFGSLLGDRIRMAEHFTHPGVFIRSMAARGSLGGLSPKIIEATDLMKAAGFDYIFIETVGVGQSEVEIAGLADTTVVILVPESGDEIQTLKSGLMEIADIFVVNKADHQGADLFAKNLQSMLHGRSSTDWEVPVIRTTATKNEGMEELLSAIEKHHSSGAMNEKKYHLLTEKALHLIQQERMKDIDRQQLLQEIRIAAGKKDFNLYSFARDRSLQKNKK